MDSLAPAPPQKWRPATPAERLLIRLDLVGIEGVICCLNVNNEWTRYTIERVENQPEDEVE